jgi:hypothetical protein
LSETRKRKILKTSTSCPETRRGISSIKGNFPRDGPGQKYQRLPLDFYIIFTMVFNLEGKKKRFKHAIILARKNQLILLGDEDELVASF